MLVRRSAPFVLAPLLLVGSLAAHALAYAAAEPDGHARAELVARTGHGYLGWAPLLVGTAGLVLVVGLALHTLRADASRSRVAGPLVALVPVAGFAVQETLERLASGTLSPALVGERAFLFGLGIQVAFGLLALFACRTLLAGAERLGRLVGAATRAAAPVLSLAAPATPADPPRPKPLATRLAGRAPPAPAS